MHPSSRFARLAAVLAVAGLGAGPALAQRTATFEPYVVRTFDGREHAAELGRVWVPEHRGRTPSTEPARDSAGWVHLAFVRLRGTSAHPGPPIVFLMGGPGIPATVIARVPVYWSLFDRLRQAGDVILLDQRGLGLSTPALDCPAPARPIPPDVFESNAGFARAYGALLAECAAHWRGRGVEPRAYTTAAVADDVDDVRQALGARRVSLLGFSYGTHLALETVRRHPDRIARVVLQGTLGPGHPARLPSAFDASLHAVAAAVAADSAAARMAPDLEGALRRTLDRLAREPLSIPIRTRGGDSVRLSVGREGYQLIVSGRLGDRRLPALVAATEQGDHGVLARFLETAYNDLAAGAGSLMARAVVCSSPGSPERAARAVREGSTALLGSPIDNHLVAPSFCGGLGGPPLAATPSAAIRSRVPALFVTGTLDDRTPPANAAEVARGFARSVVLVVANGGHEVLPATEVQRAVVDFFLGRDVRGRTLSVPPPTFASIAEAKQPPRPPGR